MEQNRGPGDDPGELGPLRNLLTPAGTAIAAQSKSTKWRSLAASVVLVASLPALALLTQGWPPILRALVIVGWALLVLVIPGVARFPLLRDASKAGLPAEAAVLNALAEVEDPRAAGMLLDAEGQSGGELRKAIQAALARLLPRVAEIATMRLSDSQFERLYTHLDALAKLARYSGQPAGFNPYPLGGTWERPKVVTEQFPELRDEYEAFLVALLTGLETLGTAETVPHIEALVANEAPSEQYARIQRAAWRCLDAIHTRLEAERAGRTLLRPTSEPSDSLVRPARNPAETSPDSLLRPSNDE